MLFWGFFLLFCFVLMSLANCIAALSQISVTASVEKLDFERCRWGVLRSLPLCFSYTHLHGADCTNTGDTQRRENKTTTTTEEQKETMRVTWGSWQAEKEEHKDVRERAGGEGTVLMYCTSRSQPSAMKQSNCSCEGKISLCKTDALFQTYPSPRVATGPRHRGHELRLPEPELEPFPASRCPAVPSFLSLCNRSLGNREI